MNYVQRRIVSLLKRCVRIFLFSRRNQCTRLIILIVLFLVYFCFVGGNKVSASQSSPLKKDNRTIHFLLDGNHSNYYWQELRISMEKRLYLYNAYSDSRKLNQLGETIRIIAMGTGNLTEMNLCCHLWFVKLEEPVVVNVSSYRYLWSAKNSFEEKGHVKPCLLSCVVPQSFRGKDEIHGVSVVPCECNNATNYLSVTHDVKPVPRRKNFAVCVKSMEFSDPRLLERLVEWFELLKILGIDNVFLYKLQVRPDHSKMLVYYEVLDFVVIIRTGLPKLDLKSLDDPDINRKFELVSYNDCFYRNLNKYEYVVFLDINEIILPIKKSNWLELLEDIQPQIGNQNLAFDNSISVYYFPRNLYFLETANLRNISLTNIPKRIHMLSSVYRRANYVITSADYIKSFFVTRRVLSVSNLSPFECIDSSSCRHFGVSVADGHLQSYLHDCKTNCTQSYTKTLDDTIWKYKDELISRVRYMLTKIKTYNKV